MDGFDEEFPARRLGYRADELERFVTEAEARSADLKRAIGDERARGRSAAAAITPAANARRVVAESWLEAHSDAERIRADVDRAIGRLADGADESDRLPGQHVPA